MAAIGLIGATGAVGQPWSASVNGNLVLDTFGNSLRVHATAVGSQASGRIVFHSGPHVIEIDVTCLFVSGSTATVGGSTISPEPSPAIHPNYSFIVEDRGKLPAKWTAFAQFPTDPANPCADTFGPAFETSVKGQLNVRSR